MTSLLLTPLLVASVACGSSGGAETTAPSPAPAAASPAPSPSPSPSADPAGDPAAASQSIEPAGPQLTCSSAGATFELAVTSLRPSPKPEEAAKSRWDRWEGTYRLTTGSITHTGTMTGVRNADYAFIHAQAVEKGIGGVAAVKVFVGERDGTSTNLSWTTGKDADGDSFEDTESESLRCTGSLLSAPAAAD